MASSPKRSMRESTLPWVSRRTLRSLNSLSHGCEHVRRMKALRSLDCLSHGREHVRRMKACESHIQLVLQRQAGHLHAGQALARIGERWQMFDELWWAVLDHVLHVLDLLLQGRNIAERIS